MLQVKSLEAGSIEWLNQAVKISLFTDARADSDDVIDRERRGHWADIFLPSDESLGSKLWLLKREKVLSTVILRAKDYCYEALDWLVDEGWLLSVNVTTEKQHKSLLAIKITGRLPNGRDWDTELEYLIGVGNAV